jgi:hypothetical protein
MQRPQRLSDFRENAMDLPRLLALERPQLVGEFDGDGRLHEDRRTGLGLIMDDATHVLLAFAANRHDVAPIANPDRRVSDPDALRKVRDKRFQFADDLVSGATQLAADPSKIRARTIQNFSGSIGDLGDTGFELRVRVQTITDEVEGFRIQRLG